MVKQNREMSSQYNHIFVLGRQLMRRVNNPIRPDEIV